MNCGQIRFAAELYPVTIYTELISLNKTFQQLAKILFHGVNFAVLSDSIFYILFFMTEEFLHYLWQYRLYSTQLTLVTGEPVSVLHPGILNRDSGPDFFNARVKIGSTLWAGNVEIHVLASDWERHRHQHDRAYENVILHVVYRNDRVIETKSGILIPVLELNDSIDKDSWQRYLKFMGSRSWIPCESTFGLVESVIRTAWLDRLLVERLERKAAQVERSLNLSANDWNQAFYRLLARNMGFKLNNDAFEILSSSISYQCLWRHAENRFQTEALVFGQAGMLEEPFKDDYHKALANEYSFLRQKFSLKAMDAHIWKFMRIHPSNFPTIRLSQFASIVHITQGLLLDLIEIQSPDQLHKMLDIEAADYWKTHYRFGHQVQEHSCRLGKTAIQLLMINFFTPFLFIYAKKLGNEKMNRQAFEMLQIIEGEDNAITRRWKSMGMKGSSGAETQALLELKSNYCDRKRCLSCGIGISLLRMKDPMEAS